MAAPRATARSDQELRTRRALLGTGATDKEIAARVRSGELVRTCHGVFATPHEVDEHAAVQRRVDYERLVRATVLRAGDPIVSHLSAVALLGLPIIDIPDRVHVTIPAASGGQRRGVIHRHPCPDPPPVIRRDGIRMTGVARTLVDVARTEPLATGVVALDAALHTEMVDLETVRAEADRCARRRGSARAFRVIALADGRTESPGESLTRLLLGDLGFPPPSVQVEAFDSDGVFLGRTDFGYLQLGVLVEFDGMVKYGGIAGGPDAVSALIAEKRREDAMRAAGFVVVRFTWRDLQDPERVRRLLDEALERGRKSVAAGLVTGTLRLAPW